MQAVFLSAASIRPKADKGDYSATLSEAGRCVRRICQDRKLREFAQPVFSKPYKSMEDIRGRFQKQLEKEFSAYQDEAIRLFRGFVRLISYATTDRRPPTRGRSSGPRHINKVEPDEPDSTLESARVFVDDGLDSAQVKLRKSSAAAPVRETPARRQVAIPLSRADAESVRSRIVQAKTRARAMATSAQQLPFASNRLQLLDVESLISWLGQNEDNRKEEAAVTLLTTMMLTSSSIQRLKEIQVLSNLPTAAVGNAPILVLNPLSWSLPVPNLKDAYVPERSIRGNFRTPSQRLIIPVPKNFPGVKKLIEVAKPAVGGRLFTWTERRLELLAARVLKEINQQTGSRLTIKRLTEFVERMVTDTTKDQADGAFFSSRENTSGSAARLYYYCPLEKILVDAYMQVWKEIFSGKQFDWSWIPPLNTGNAYLGAAGCPTDAAITLAIGTLKSRVRRLARGRRTKSKAIEFHNAFTSYMTLFGMWGAALRAVNDPIEMELIDPIIGFLGISEKDSDDYATCRVVPLVPILLEQLKAYARHRHVFLDVMNKSGIQLMPQNWLFYVNNDRPQPVTPALLEKTLGASYPFPLNAQRHYLRTQLRERGVRGAFVDALLGHGELGEEPYGRYSAISPFMVKRAIETPLQELLSNMGWQVIQGMH